MISIVYLHFAITVLTNDFLKKISNVKFILIDSSEKNFSIFLGSLVARVAKEIQLVCSVRLLCYSLLIE
jgi:hypothetical protein